MKRQWRERKHFHFLSLVWIEKNKKKENVIISNDYFTLILYNVNISLYFLFLIHLQIDLISMYYQYKITLHCQLIEIQKSVKL